MFRTATDKWLQKVFQSCSEFTDRSSWKGEHWPLEQICWSSQHHQPSLHTQNHEDTPLSHREWKLVILAIFNKHTVNNSSLTPLMLSERLQSTGVCISRVLPYFKHLGLSALCLLNWVPQVLLSVRLAMAKNVLGSILTTSGSQVISSVFN